MVKTARASAFFMVLLAAASAPVHASEVRDAKADTLSGLLSFDVKPGPRPFIIAGNLYVPPGTTVKIAQGTVFLFENFTGLHVQGTLLAQGTPESPIVFTSKNDREWNPSATAEAAPFDWNGIDLDEGAVGTEFSGCFIRYSVFGLKSQTDLIRLNNVRFAFNGKTDLAIKGEPRKVDHQPFSYNPVGAVLPARPAASEDRRVRLRATARYICMALAIGGCTASLWGFSEYPHSQRRFQQINSPNADGALLYTSADWRKAKQTLDRNRAALIVGTVIGVIGIAGIVVTFTF